MSTYRERRLARAERLREWAAKRAARSTGNFKRAHDIVSGIPLGQPILVGHHSERRHRRTLERSDHAMRQACEDSDKAASMTSRAGNIEAAVDRAIYRDDPDAIERLTAKIADLEARRDRMKAENDAYRKAHRAELKALPSAWERSQAMPYASYQFQNLGGTITKERKRLADLTARKTSRGDAIVSSHADTPIARAGLTITKTLTTPRKAWKKPREVWNVSGNLAYWRPILVEQLGGSEYHGAVSFWEDPTDAIERACLDAEQARHEADDPHCTCNDCLASHEARLSEGERTQP